MIKIFRKIRQKLLSENKINKYLLYAIGEIILVVIGILIALSINNWNENKKKENLRVSYLFEMMKEVQGDVSVIGFRLNALEKNMANHEAALKTKNIKELSLDSLKMILELIITNISFKQITYHKMNNLGLTRLSNDESLNNQITKYYDSDIPYLIAMNDYFITHSKKVSDFFRYNQNKIDQDSDFSNIEFPSLYKEELKTEENIQRINILEFIQSIQGRSLVLRNIELKRTIKSRLTNFEWKAIDLLENIYIELNKNNEYLEFKPVIPDAFDVGEIKLSATELKKFVGQYEYSKDLVFSITLEKSKLYGYINGELKTQLIPTDEKTFVSPRAKGKVRFTIENGIVISLTTDKNNEEITARKIE